MPGPELSIVIPAYNEEARLPDTLGKLHAFVTEHGLSCEIIVVDNGSTDGTDRVLQDAATRDPSVRPLHTERRGKGLAVRTGMLTARGNILLFADADLSWPLEELIRFPSLVSDAMGVVIGSREGQGARRVGEPPYRHLMGRVFNGVVQALAVPGVQDTQCGFKVFRADAARAIFERQRVNGFGFDVEVLYLARSLGFRILEVPLRWEHKENSRVQPGRDALRMLADVATIRRNSLLGRYRRRLATTSPIQT